MVRMGLHLRSVDGAIHFLLYSYIITLEQFNLLIKNYTFLL